MQLKTSKRRKLSINHKSGIAPGTTIGINHVMALILCKFSSITREFREVFHNRRDGDIDILYAKHYYRSLEPIYVEQLIFMVIFITNNIQHVFIFP